MGHEVEKAALARQHKIVVTIDNPKEWEERIEMLKQADVAIDFSQPDQVVGNIHSCFTCIYPSWWAPRLGKTISRKSKNAVSTRNKAFSMLPTSALG